MSTTETANSEQEANNPAFVAWHVPDRENAKWSRIGAAWHHRDGKGFTLQLDLLPTATGRIVLRKFEPKQVQPEQEAAA